MSHLNKFVLVTWEDAWNGSASYYTYKEIDEETPLILQCVGYCIRDNKAGISLATTLRDNHGKNDGFRHIQHIPRAMVRKVRVLR